MTTHFTTSGVIQSDTEVRARTHTYTGRLAGVSPVITSVDVGAVHFQGDPDVMLAFADRVRDAVAASIAAHMGTLIPPEDHEWSESCARCLSDRFAGHLHD